MNCAFVFALLVPLAPFFAAFGIAVYVLNGAQGDDAEPPTARLAEGSAWLSLAILLALDVLAWQAGAPGHVALGTWFASGVFRLPFSLMLDPLSLGFGTLVALIGVITLRFSRTYLHREAGFHRFFLLMSLFLAGMLLVVLAGNAGLTFVGWEFCGISSYLLIGYAYDRPVATGNALYAFLTNRIGDAGLILGIALSTWWLGTLEWPGLATWTAGSGFDKVQARLLVFGFLLAAVAKSAQLPFAAWIARALEGPTPSSAIFYGAVMVHAGVYLVIRLAPVLVQVPDIMVYLALIGALTAAYGWFGSLVQTDVKSSLVFATTTQVGLMFLACGLGWFEWAAWHMGLHAAWRAYQFLLAPSYMHLVKGKAHLTHAPPVWLARRQWLYTASLQRFWIEAVTRSAVTRPVLAVGHDMRDFDDNILAHLVGMPERQRAGKEAGDADVIRAHGLAGRLLSWAAERLQRLESYLVMRPGESALTRGLHHVGIYLRVLEALFERPRYLIIAIAATFVVIL